MNPAIVLAAALAGPSVGLHPSVPAPVVETVRQVVADWNAVGCSLTFRENGPGDISVFWGLGIPEIPSDILAVAAPLTTGGQGVLVLADRVKGFDLRTILDHEIGHTLGLVHTRTGLMAPGIDKGEIRRPGPVEGLAACGGK